MFKCSAPQSYILLYYVFPKICLKVVNLVTHHNIALFFFVFSVIFIPYELNTIDKLQYC